MHNHIQTWHGPMTRSASDHQQPYGFVYQVASQEPRFHQGADDRSASDNQELYEYIPPQISEIQEPLSNSSAPGHHQHTSALSLPRYTTLLLSSSLITNTASQQRHLGASRPSSFGGRLSHGTSSRNIIISAKLACRPVFGTGLPLR